MARGKLRHKNNRQDAFYKRAKQDQFAARSVYKLQEIDERFHIFRPGQRVLDLGCWPGSWLQYASLRIGAGGLLVGVDRFPVEVEIVGPSFYMVTGDVFVLEREHLQVGSQGFDVVLSDMAPDTSGIRTQDQARSETLFTKALDLAEKTLCPGGCFVGKLFQGPGWNALLQRMRGGFVQVRILRPQGTRPGSIEQYLIGLQRQ